jgi:hypothetical protein
MNIKNFFQSIQNTFRPQEKLQDEVVVRFLRILENVGAEELSCGEIYARLDEFVETEVQSKDAGKITPLIREHLDTCPDCCEEYEALLAVLENTKEQ